MALQLATSRHDWAAGIAFVLTFTRSMRPPPEYIAGLVATVDAASSRRPKKHASRMLD